jgi:hypothetical protein
MESITLVEIAFTKDKEIKFVLITPMFQEKYLEETIKDHEKINFLIVERFVSPEYPISWVYPHPNNPEIKSLYNGVLYIMRQSFD